jgi:regulator of replication initiation timing
MNNTIEQQKTITGTKRPYYPVLVCSSAEPGFYRAEGYGFALVPDFSEKEVLKKILPVLINGSRKFMLLIHEEQVFMNTDAISSIIDCLFSPNYISIDGKPVIGFISDETKTGSKSDRRRDTLLSGILEQGWSSLVCWAFIKTPAGGIEPVGDVPVFVNHLGTEKDFKELYLSDLQTITEYILFSEDTFDKTQELEQNFYEALQATISQYPLLKKGLWDFVQEKRTAARLRSRNASLEEKLANAEKTISVIRDKYKDDYENLFKWYHNEYEILPLWYKRFGHILKVLMGKRTFRSLFNDDVKKYKT